MAAVPATFTIASSRMTIALKIITTSYPSKPIIKFMGNMTKVVSNPASTSANTPKPISFAPAKRSSRLANATNDIPAYAKANDVDPVDYYGLEYDPIEELKSRGYSFDDLVDDFPEFDYGND